MPESKIELTHRLEREGRWAEASVIRDRVRKERRAAGDTRDVANDAAWEAMAKEYPPIPAITQAGKASTRTSESAEDPFSDDDDSDSLPENLPAGSATSIQADLLWAYQNICSPVTEAMAPSGAAWALRTWGRSAKGRDKFIGLVVKTFKPKEDEDGRHRDDRARQFSTLGELSREFAGIEQRCPLCNGVFTHEQQAAQAKLAQSSP